MKEEESIAVAAVHAPPAVLVAVNLQNLKAFNAIAGHERGDRLLEQTQRRLSVIGRTWRTGGGEFVTLAGGSLAEITEQVKAFSWLVIATVGATEAWTFRFTDGREPVTKPWRSFLVTCTPRCGLAEVGSNASQALELARNRCDALRGPAGVAPPGFAPLSPKHWSAETRLLSPACPACGHDKPAIIKDDLGWSAEKCPRCDASYERSDVLCVLGEQIEGGYG